MAFQLDTLLEDMKHHVMAFKMEGMPHKMIALERALK